MSCVLYNWDALTEGCHAIIVEGIGDVVGWEAQGLAGRSIGRIGEGNRRGSERSDRDVAVEKTRSTFRREATESSREGLVRRGHHDGGCVEGNAGRDAGRGETCGAPPGRGVPVAICGSACSDDHAALLAAKAPGRVTVALDATAEGASRRAAALLRDWGLDAEAATWSLAKDAGAGGVLVPLPPSQLVRVNERG